MKRWLVALALALPLAGIAAAIARNEIALASATEWIIPVTGFDPRDPLRGHYIAFRYEWEAQGDLQLCRNGQCLLCLERGEGNLVVARIVERTPRPDCAGLVDLEASRISPDFASRIYVSEASAPKLEQMMRDGPMQVVARLRRDGVLMNERLDPAGDQP